MFDFVSNIWYDSHAAIVHFPIALLFLSFALAFLARRRPKLNETSWILLVVGATTAVAATITGLISHEPYESTDLIVYIEPHQYLGIAGTILTTVLLIWRFRARRRGADVGTRSVYLGIAAAGLLWLILLGGTGGNLVYQHGVNVRGINPLIGKKVMKLEIRF